MRNADFIRIAAAVATMPPNVRVAMTWEAARTICTKFHGRVLLVFIHAVGRIGPDGTTPTDIERLAALTGLPVTATEALLGELARAGFLAVMGRGRNRRVTFPFMTKRRPADTEPSSPLRPPPPVAASCLQH